MSRRGRLSVGQWVEVRNKAEILRTLDKNGQLDGLPFMPEMLGFCGKRLRVYKRAHKTCDTVTGGYKGRRMRAAVHLEGSRCDGQSHGGCEAECLLFWKEAWLRKSPDPGGNQRVKSAEARDPVGRADAPGRCSESDMHAACVVEAKGEHGEPVYHCQATQLPAATEPLSSWDWRQYVVDYTSGNVSLGRIASGCIYMGCQRLIYAGIGLGEPLRWLYDRFQKAVKGAPYPRRRGTIPVGERTPNATLDLQPGEWVRVKDYRSILATCDRLNRNRGLTFDAEMVPYCGRSYRVLKRVTKIINEQTGMMQPMKNPCIILEGVVCQSRYSECRLFCPRSIYSYWREIWLERIKAPPASRPENKGSLTS